MSDNPRAFLQAIMELRGLDAETAQIAAGAFDDYSRLEQGGKTDVLFASCESPMERRFLMPLAGGINGSTILALHAWGCTFRCGDVSFALDLQTEHSDADDNPDIIFARTDFRLFQFNPARGFSLVIEVDGHEFHEKTKEQAQRDKARDRKLTRLGSYIIRFTGSEIHADPVKCWLEVMAIAQALSDIEIVLEGRATKLLSQPVQPVQVESEIGRTESDTSSSASNASIHANGAQT